jgi:hypothetical protein
VKRRVAAFACFAWLALSGCRTPPDAFSPAGWAALTAADPRPALRVAGLRELAETRHALRATARVGSEGPEGAVSTDQLLLVERPASLRVEVIGGVLQQRVLVLATDGTRYELYRAEGPVTEEGAVHAGVLEEVAGLPLTPEAAVRLLLAAPLAPDTPAESVQQDALGALRLRWPDQTLEFDGAGRLAALAFHPGERGERGERAVLYARWSDWRALDTGAFPHRLELELPEAKTRWQLEYRQVELDPELDPALFRLGLGTR